MTAIRRLYAIAPLLMLAACPAPEHATASAPDTKSPSATHVYAYRCGDLAVTGHFSREQVTLDMGGKTLMLPQAMSASGARYADAQGNEFWGKGLKDATLTLAGKAPRTCSGSGQEISAQP